MTLAVGQERGDSPVVVIMSTTYATSYYGRQKPVYRESPGTAVLPRQLRCVLNGAA